MKKYWFVYESLLWGRKRILAKAIKTESEMRDAMDAFPGTAFCEVAALTYEYMAVGDAW
jgi:hypothetical protein